MNGGMTIYRVIRGMFGLETGRSCRRCAEIIDADDAFGQSESVCGPCRHEPALSGAASSGARSIS